MRWYTREDQIVFEGDLDEHALLNEILLPPGPLRLDLAGIRRVNSAGVHKLITCLLNLGDRDQLVIEVERCSPTVVAQLNLLPALSSQFRVRSVLAAMECPTCLGETDVLIEIGPDPVIPSIPPIPCDRCGTAMELETDPEVYFAFLNEQD